MKIGTDTGDFKSLSHLFSKLCHFKAFDDYVILYYNNKIIYIVTFSIIYNEAPRDVVIISL